MYTVLVSENDKIEMMFLLLESEFEARSIVYLSASKRFRYFQLLNSLHGKVTRLTPTDRLAKLTGLLDAD